MEVHGLGAEVSAVCLESHLNHRLHTMSTITTAEVLRLACHDMLLVALLCTANASWLPRRWVCRT